MKIETDDGIRITLEWAARPPQVGDCVVIGDTPYRIDRVEYRCDDGGDQFQTKRGELYGVCSKVE